MAIEKHTVNEQTGAAIYGESDNLNYFLKTALEPDTIGGIEARTKSYPKRTVRRYVGDPNPYEIPPVATVRYLYDPGRRNGSATPGQEMILDDGTEKRSFTFTGSYIDIHAFIMGNAKMDLTLYSPGASNKIKAADGGELIAPTSAKR